MDDISRTGWNLVVIQGNEDILSIAAVDALSLFIKHIGIDEIGPWVHLAFRVHTTATPNQAFAIINGKVQPQLIGI